MESAGEETFKTEIADLSMRPDSIDDDENSRYLHKVSKSCDLCKQRKVGCDGQKPRCSNCIKNDKICNYSLMKKPGLKLGYGKSLNDKISRLESSHLDLENLVLAMSSRLESLENGKSSTKRQKLANGSPSKVSESPYSNRDESSGMMFPPLPGSTNHSSGHSTHSTHSIHRSATSTSTTSSSTHSHQAIALPSLLNPFVDSSEQKFNNTDLPSREIMQKLCTLYFQYVNPIFPILNPSLAHEQIFGDQNEANYLAYGVALVSLKYLNDESAITSEQKIAFYKSWKQKILVGCFDVCNLDKLTTMALLAFESMGQSNDQETWSLVAIVCSGTLHLDLINENSPVNSMADTPGSMNSSSSNPSKSISTRNLKLLRKPKTFAEEEHRRRVFWCVYVLDRLNGVLSSSFFKIPESDITCRYPMSTEKWLENVRLPVLDSFGHCIQLFKIFGNTHDFNRMKVDINNRRDCEIWYETFIKIETDLKHFVDSLPFAYSALLVSNDISNWSAPSSYDLLLHTMYNITLIKLHSPLGYPHHESDFFKHSKASRSICSNCCSNVLNMVGKLGNAHLLYKLGPMYAIFLWIVTRVIIVEEIMGQHNYELVIDQSEYAKVKLESLLNVLENIGESWAIAKKYCKIIRFLGSSKITLNNKVHKTNVNAASATNPETGSPDRSTVVGSGAGGDEEDSDEQVANRDPSSIITDMTLNTYLVSLALTHQIEAKEKEINDELQSSFEYNGLDPNASKFQLDLNSYGFEDFFRYLGDINTA